MKQITKTVYTVQELKEQHAQGKMTTKAWECVLEWLRDTQTDNDWYADVYEMWTAALDQIGFTNAKIAFSGFWSQGDGASFTADIDFAKLLDFLTTQIEPCDSVGFDGKKEDFRGWLVKQLDGKKATCPRYRRLLCAVNYLCGRVVRVRAAHHYSHERTCCVEIELRDNRGLRLLERLTNELQAEAEELRCALSRAIYASLEKEYDYFTSEPQLLESAAANDYTFTLYGEREG